MENADKPAAESAGRRRFLAGVVYGITVGIGAPLAALLSRFFAAPLLSRSRGRPREAVLGPLSRFRDAKEPVPAYFENRVTDGYLTRTEKVRVYVVADRGEFLCLSTTCTHLGCSVRWDSERQQFLCPCHGGVYAKNGTVVSGPPPRPLARVPVQVAQDQLTIRVEDLV